MMSDMKKITVVIPNLNGMKYLKGCLSSLREQKEQSFVVILEDNGSTDGSVEYVRENFPEVRIRVSRKNTGFCRAVNDGILLAETPYVLLLNNDTVSDPSMLGNLLEAMESGGEDVFSCQAKMVSMRQPDTIDDAGDIYTALGWAYARGKGKSTALYTVKEECFASCAAAALYRREIFRKIGLFDERHFAYLEDIDIGWRAKVSGFRNLYVPDAVVFHLGSATSGSRHNAFKVRQAAGNNLYMIVKNMPPMQLALNAPLILTGTLIKAAYFARLGLGASYLSGLRRGLALTRKLEPGRGPVWSSSEEERMQTAGFSVPEKIKGSAVSYLRIQLELVRGLFSLAKDRR